MKAIVPAVLLRDAIRLLVRPRAILLLTGVGLLLGTFVRATQQSFAAELSGLDARGAAAQSLLSGLFLLAACAGLVFGVLLGHEDRGSGLISQLAIRPVSRFHYATGRVAGLGLASIASILVAVIAAAAIAGLDASSLPELRIHELPIRTTVAGREIAAGDVASLDHGERATFAFRAGVVPRFEFPIEPREKLAAADAPDEERFAGYVDFTARCLRDGADPETVTFDHVRPIGSVLIEFTPSRPGSFTIEIENRTKGALLAVGGDRMRVQGEARSAGMQVILAALLLVAAGAIVAALSFCLATALSSGPAALAASFLLLIALGRDAVLDLVDESSAGLGGSGAGDALRGWLRGAVRVVPDLSRFDASDRLGRGAALEYGHVAATLGSAALYVAALTILTALLLSWRDRR